MKEVICKLKCLPGITVELCGKWLWIFGDIYTSQKELRAIGCRFSRRKKMWYYHEGEFKKLSKRELPIEEIEKMYGSVEV